MEEILNQLLEGQKQLLERVNQIEDKMATKDDIVRIEHKLDAVYAQIAGLNNLKHKQVLHLILSRKM